MANKITMKTRVLDNITRKGYEKGMEMSFKSKTKLTPNQVVARINKERDIMKKAGVRNVDLYVDVLTNAGNTVYSRPFGLSDKIDLNDKTMFNSGEEDANWEHTNDFAIFVWKRKTMDGAKMLLAPSKKGGCDGNWNDCLFRCIERAFGEEFLLASGINTPPKFKKFLKLKVDEPVSIDLIPKVEKKLSCNINVSGDYTHTSKQKHLKQMNLQLKNGHYSYFTKENKKEDILKGLSFKLQKPIVIENTNKDEFYAFDGEKKYKTTWKEMNDIKKNFMTSEYFIYRCEKDKTLEKTYDDLVNDRELLKEATHGRIDLFKSRGNIKNAVLFLLYNDIAHIHDFEEITEFEEIWLTNATKGGLIFATKTKEFQKGYCYDVNSAYPSNLLKINIPTKQPEFITIEEDEPKRITYGIYRCEITPTNDENINRLFKFNDTNFYTHYDLEFAKSQNLKIKMIHDDQPNYMSYTKKYIAGETLFGKTVRYLYQLKKDKVPRAKQLLSQLWGSCCRTSQNTITDKAPEDIPEDCDVIGMSRIYDKEGNENILYRLIKKGHMMRYRLGRLKPFLLAYSRLKLARDILPNNENVYRVHTDSILTTVMLDNLEIGTELGQYKIEKHSWFKVINSNQVEWLKD